MPPNSFLRLTLARIACVKFKFNEIDTRNVSALSLNTCKFVYLCAV